MRNFALVLLALALLIPLTGVGNYPLHLMVMALLWSFIYTSWAIMGRLGLVSFGHGAFLGIGAYTQNARHAQLLLEAGANPYAKTSAGRDPTSMARKVMANEAAGVISLWILKGCQAGKPC